MDYSLYGLAVAGEQERYLGISSRSLNARLDEHIRESVYRRRTHKRNWLRSALDAGCAIEIEQLDTASTSSEANWLERLWVAVYSICGIGLTNTTSGGDGAFGMTHTEETKAKMRLAHLGKKHPLVWFSEDA